MFNHHISFFTEAHVLLIIGLFCVWSPEGPSLLGLSNISVNASMTVNDTAVTNVTISRLEAPDPVDSLDLTVCPADDILDGCKVSSWFPFGSSR